MASTYGVELLRWKLVGCDVFHAPKFVKFKFCIVVGDGNANHRYGQHMHMCVEDFHW